MPTIKDTLVWVWKFLRYEREFPEPAEKEVEPVKEPVPEFDKTGWTYLWDGALYNRSVNPYEPVELMRDGWEAPWLLVGGLNSIHPAMNIAGLYWRKLK